MPKKARLPSFPRCWSPPAGVAVLFGSAHTRGVLQSMGSQRVGHSWECELNWTVQWFALSCLFKPCSNPSFPGTAGSMGRDRLTPESLRYRAGQGHWPTAAPLKSRRVEPKPKCPGHYSPSLDAFMSREGCCLRFPVTAEPAQGAILSSRPTERSPGAPGVNCLCSRLFLVQLEKPGRLGSGWPASGKRESVSLCS